MRVYNKKKFDGIDGLSVSIYTTVHSKEGTTKLGELLDEIKAFYESKLRNSRTILREEMHFGKGKKYEILNDRYIELGHVLIVPKGGFSKSPHINPDEDYPVTRNAIFGETYWVTFKPKQIKENPKLNHVNPNVRDGFFDFLK